MKISLAILVLIASFGISSAASCSYFINSSNSANFGVLCDNATVYFSKGVSNSSLTCNGGIVSSLVFDNNTYNNTVYNCTFSGSEILSMHNAENNLISPHGTYELKFEDNYSNVALGYTFTFVPLNQNGMVGMQGFAAVMPYSLEQKNPGLAQTQGTKEEDLISAAHADNYSLPRFGVYAAGPVTNGKNITFKLETEQIYKNRTINYNPYWFICPFWGWDELTFKTFYIYGDMKFTPTLIFPDMMEDIQYPDNTSIFWNYTVIKYDNAPNMTAYLWSGYQVDPNGKIMAIFHNITNGTISYRRGIQTPGIHETIAVIKSPEMMEHDNSTTETYAVGLSFCTDTQPPIIIPGYYSLAYGSLHQLRTFWTTNKTCATPLIIKSNNVTIDCKGGVINSTDISISVLDSNMVEIENCNVYGNAFYIQNSNFTAILNSKLYANSPNETAIVAYNSNVILSNVTFYGYSKEYNLTKSSVSSKLIKSVSLPNKVPVKAIAINNISNSSMNGLNRMFSMLSNEFLNKPKVDFEVLLLFVATTLTLSAAFYMLILALISSSDSNRKLSSKRMEKNNKGKRSKRPK
ncbi:MAG: hypothetical protein ACP5K5_03845 [Candidatus Micrarchaeia archaeon]